MIYLPELDTHLSFPNPSEALLEPDGLLAMGGDLSSERLIYAYQHGIFPWFSQDEPILWWSPSERMVLGTDEMQPSKSMRKFIRKTNWRLSANQATEEVIRLCASTRPESERWITSEMQAAYIQLAHEKKCQSVEVWDHQDKLIGGLYGLTIGQTFCGESMFSLASNASKFAFWGLCNHFGEMGGKLIDCQLHNPHLESLGAYLIPRERYLNYLKQHQSAMINEDFLFAHEITDFKRWL